MILYAVFAMGASANNNIPEKSCVVENVCEVQNKAPENKVGVEFLERNYEKIMDQKSGNIPMAVFKERLGFVIYYRPKISEYLDTSSYRYQLTPEIKEKVRELVDGNSYANTVNKIHEWINSNIEYVYNREWYTAQSTWEKSEANCNGISFLTCGMMREVGIPCIVVANRDHAWTEYLYVDDAGRLVWSIWDQGIEGYPALSDNIYEYDLN